MTTIGESNACVTANEAVGILRSAELGALLQEAAERMRLLGFRENLLRIFPSGYVAALPASKSAA